MRSWAAPGKETGIHREHMAPPADEELSLAVDTNRRCFDVGVEWAKVSLAAARWRGLAAEQNSVLELGAM